MAQPIKISRATAARASASVSTELPNTGINIDPIEEARKLQFMHRLGMCLLAVVLILLNVAYAAGVNSARKFAIATEQPVPSWGGEFLVSIIISIIVYLVVWFFARLALARAVAALMTWHYTERTATASFANKHLLQTLLDRLSVEQ